MAINDALPPKAAPRDAIAKLKSFWSFESELQRNPMPFHLDSPWGATLISLRACAMDWRVQQNTEGGQKLRSYCKSFANQSPWNFTTM